MTIEYTIDFTSVLTQKLTPRLNEVQTWLNCGVKDIGRGNIIVQTRPGIFLLRVHDDAKGKALENKKINYYLPGDVGGKKPIEVTIKKREIRKRWVNPKYITIWDVYKEDMGDVLTNKTLTKYLEKYGTILEPVEDVTDLSENAWALDKKKCRIDLDKELHIPRNFPIETPAADGTIKKGTLRITYRDQPWYCRRCRLDHDGECPKRMEDRRREEEIREQKAKETKTLILGDSNLKLVNANAILADVTASSGAKIGHITNQMDFEKMEKYENVVLMVGVNNVPGQNDRGDENSYNKQIDVEMKALETELSKHVKKGKNVYLTQVANPKHVRNSQRGVNIRTKINKDFHDMKNRLKSHNKKAKVDIINWSPFDDEDDYSTVKSISDRAMIRFLQKVDEKLEGKLRAKYLDTVLTAHPYSTVGSTYPPGCYKCTKMGHSEDSCTVDYSKKRNRSEEIESQGPEPKVTSIDHCS